MNPSNSDGPVRNRLPQDETLELGSFDLRAQADPVSGLVKKDEALDLGALPLPAGLNLVDLQPEDGFVGRYAQPSPQPETKVVPEAGGKLGRESTGG